MIRLRTSFNLYYVYTMIAVLLDSDPDPSISDLVHKEEPYITLRWRRPAWNLPDIHMFHIGIGIYNWYIHK